MAKVRSNLDSQRSQGPATILAIGTVNSPTSLYLTDQAEATLFAEVTKLGKQAAMKAINEWGQPVAKITHLIFSSRSGAEADLSLMELLGLEQSVKRLVICSGAVIDYAKDIAENNAGARVLVVFSDFMNMYFHDQEETHKVFGDGAAAIIVGADPDHDQEHPLFHVVSSSTKNWQEKGKNADKIIADALSPIGISDWNSLFYIVHPWAGAIILDQIEEELGLEKQKLRASRSVVSEYGNMGAASVLFVMDEMRKNSIEERKATTGDGFEWGVLQSVGPEQKVDTLVLLSVPLNHSTY